MRIGDIIEIGTRTIPAYVPPKPGAMPIAPTPQPQRAPAKPAPERREREKKVPA